MNTFPFSNSNMILMHFVILKFPDFKNTYTLLTINKGSSVFRTSSFLLEEKHDKGNFNNIATFKGERLEGKFVSSNVISLLRRNLSEAEILD